MTTFARAYRTKVLDKYNLATEVGHYFDGQKEPDSLPRQDWIVSIEGDSGDVYEWEYKVISNFQKFVISNEFNFPLEDSPPTYPNFNTLVLFKRPLDKAWSWRWAGTKSFIYYPNYLALTYPLDLMMCLSEVCIQREWDWKAFTDEYGSKTSKGNKIGRSNSISKPRQ